MSLESRHERADRLVADIGEALKRDGDQVIWRYAHTLAALRAVWKSRRKLQDQVALLEDLHRPSGVLALRKRVAELEAFVADIACHGLRADLNPTMDCSTPEKYAAGMQRYLKRVDGYLREDARRLVPDADHPYSAGRPRPAAKVEIVADPETELGVLLEQQRTEGGVQ